MSTWTNILDLVYPVGAVYTSNSDTSPATLFGGTWTQLKEKFIFAAGTTYKVNNTGGATTVTLTVKQMPSHTHPISPRPWTAYDNGYFAGGGGYTVVDSWGDEPIATATGGGQAHNNMPPYQVFYVWYRTA